MNHILDRENSFTFTFEKIVIILILFICFSMCIVSYFFV